MSFSSKTGKLEESCEVLVIFRSKVQKANISFLAKQTRVCDSVV